MAETSKPRRTRVERGIYRQPNGKLAVCARHAGRLHFRTCGGDLEHARGAREELIEGLETIPILAASESIPIDRAPLWTIPFPSGRGSLVLGGRVRRW